MTIANGGNTGVDLLRNFLSLTTFPVKRPYLCTPYGISSDHRTAKRRQVHTF